MSDAKTSTALATREAVDLQVQDFRERMEFEKERLRLMREFVQSQMVEGVHYGKIPGTSGKKTLLKPGAELLMNIHGFAAEFLETEREIDRTATKDFSDKYGKPRTRTGYAKYSYRCILSKAGQKIAEGVGTCNSWERKYLAVDMDDVENTIMKMAKKRSVIDAILMGTRTSDFFSQDLEDKVAPVAANAGADEDGPPPDEPGANDGPPPERTKADKGDDTISDPQRRRLYAISKAAQGVNDWSDQDLKDRVTALLARFNYESTKDIAKRDYEAISAEMLAWEKGL